MAQRQKQNYERMKHLWNAGNNEEGLNILTRAGRGTVCTWTAFSHFLSPRGAVRILCFLSLFILSFSLYHISVSLCLAVDLLSAGLWESTALQTTHMHTKDSADCGYDTQDLICSLFSHSEKTLNRYEFMWETAHLSVSFSFSLGLSRSGLSEGNADFPPVCLQLWGEKEEVSTERVKDGDERGGGNAISHTGCKVHNGKAQKAAQNRPTLFLAAICSLSVFRQYLTWGKYRHNSEWDIIYCLSLIFNMYECQAQHKTNSQQRGI